MPRFLFVIQSHFFLGSKSAYKRQHCSLLYQPIFFVNKNIAKGQSGTKCSVKIQSNPIKLLRFTSNYCTVQYLLVSPQKNLKLVLYILTMHKTYRCFSVFCDFPLFFFFLNHPPQTCHTTNIKIRTEKNNNYKRIPI